MLLIALAACLPAQGDPEGSPGDCPSQSSEVSTCTGLTVESTSPPVAPTDRNISGGPLAVCSLDPLTGYFRDGSCRTDPTDGGVHVVCASVTDAFLQYSAAQGNDLMTPSPAYRFPGLREGDRWCLCALRWEEARQAGVAPPIVPEATHARALELVAAEDLQRAAISTESPAP